MSLTERLIGSPDIPRASGIDADTVFSVLSASRRRIVIRYVAGISGGQEIELGELAEVVAIDEYGPRFDSSQRKSAYIGLYQVHMDSLVGAGVVRDVGRNVYQKGPNADALAHAADAVFEVAQG